MPGRDIQDPVVVEVACGSRPSSVEILDALHAEALRQRFRRCDAAAKILDRKILEADFARPADMERDRAKLPDLFIRDACTTAAPVQPGTGDVRVDDRFERVPVIGSEIGGGRFRER